jgi:hypothetical protein
VVGCLAVYLGLFGLGAVLLGRALPGSVTLAVAVLLVAWLWRAAAAPRAVPRPRGMM